LKFLDRFSKNTEIQSFKKICPVGAKLFHVYGQTDRQTDMIKLIVAFYLNMVTNTETFIKL